MKIELKKLKISLPHSEETICFVADVYVNGVRVAYASNDGHGGNTYYQADLKHIGLLEQAEQYALTLPSIKYGSLEITMDLEKVIDDLVMAKLKSDEDKKYQKRLEKDLAHNICWGIPNGSYRMVGYKNKLTLLQELNTIQGVNRIEKILDVALSKLEEGEEIFNKDILIAMDSYIKLKQKNS
jgi:hypothetical protein